jgi:hypothetical protein
LSPDAHLDLGQADESFRQSKYGTGRGQHRTGERLCLYRRFFGDNVTVFLSLENQPVSSGVLVIVNFSPVSSRTRTEGRRLEPEFCTSTDTGRTLVTVLGMVAEMERRFILERQRAGIETAKKKGVYKGRIPSVTVETVRKMRGEGKGPAEIAAALGVSRMSCLARPEGRSSSVSAATRAGSIEAANH